ncbi:MAG: twin-arginine translocase TatA/TatE family subunit [Chloroflexi bacterium]|nr:twin-arginine translocase TatA/TatE family subunit [Chloroflexota bacterium]
MPFRLGPMELIIVLVIVMVIFGVGKLPQIGGAMGKAIREFRKSQTEISEDLSLDAPKKPEDQSEKS